MSDLTPRDHAMIRHAANRGPIHYGDHTATLIAWKPTRRGRREKTARIEYASGRRLTVPVNLITIPTEDAA